MTQDELFEHMREWNAFVRRHNANIFDVMLKMLTIHLKMKNSTPFFQMSHYSSDWKFQ